MSKLPRKRIAVVGPIYGGSTSVAECAVRALGRLGHDVVYVDSTGHKPTLDALRASTDPEPLKTRMTGMFLEMVRGKCREATMAVKPDLALYLAQAPVLRDEDLAPLRQAGIPTIFWFVEDRDMFPVWRTLGGRYDHFWTIQPGGFADELRALGQRFVDHVPLGCDPHLHHPGAPADAGADAMQVSFVGSAYPNRVQLLRGLADLPGLRLFGPRWASDPALRPAVQVDGTVAYNDLPRVFQHSRINLNLSSAVDPALFATRKEFVNPRAFEIGGCAGFQLVEALCPIESFFDPGSELVTFTGPADARDKIAHYLGHESERLAIAAAGHRRAMAHHTYDRRLEDALLRAAAVDDRIGRPVTC